MAASLNPLDGNGSHRTLNEADAGGPRQVVPSLALRWSHASGVHRAQVVPCRWRATRSNERMEPSPELEALARRRAEAFNTRDTETVLNLYADEPGLIVIGSDPDEWWSGHATM